MIVLRKDPPREFEVGFGPKVMLKDCGTVALAANEQVTLVTESGGEYDVTRKDWGFYATPSTNARLANFGLRTVIVRNRLNRLFVLLIEGDKQQSFERYLADEKLDVVTWLDNQDACDRLVERMQG